MEEALATWFEERLGADLVTISDFHKHIEGFSWETHSMTLSWSESGVTRERGVVVHRVPTAGLLPRYSVPAQWDLLRALEDIDGVPTARTLWADPEGEATGRPLYVVERIEGSVPTPWTVKKFFDDDSGRKDLGRKLAALGAAIHSIPLADLPQNLRGADSESPALAEIAYWGEVYERERLTPIPVLERALDWLNRNSHMMSGHVGLVHGDLRTGNFIMRDAEIVAMLDWELAHAGDPVQDLAHCAMKLYRTRDGYASGLLPIDELLLEYGRHAGWTVPPEAFAYWTVLLNVEGVVTFVAAQRRFEEGATHDVRYAALGYQLHYMLVHVLDALDAAEALTGKSF